MNKRLVTLLGLAVLAFAACSTRPDTEQLGMNSKISASEQEANTPLLPFRVVPLFHLGY